MADADFSTLKTLRCPLLEQPTDDMCTGDLVKLLAFNTAVLERALLESIIPAGIVSYFGGLASEIPPRSLICDGSFYKKETYPELFEAIRYSYGRDGDCFAVPDLRVTIIQGNALNSSCMDQAELSEWEGFTNNAGAPTLGDVVGARIKHANTQFFNSETGNQPSIGQSLYGKMAMIPIISTGELCGRYELVSSGSASCAITDLGEITFDEDSKTLTHISSSGKVATVVLSGLVDPTSTNDNGNANSSVMISSTLLKYGEIQFGDIVATNPTNLVVTGDFTATNTSTNSGDNFVECVFNTALPNDEYNVLLEMVSLGNPDNDNDLKSPIITSKSPTGFIINIEETNATVQDLQINARIESKVPVTTSVPVTTLGSGDCGKQFYYPDNGITAWSGSVNLNTTVDLNTFAGVTVPSWATHVILYGLFASAQTASQGAIIGGRRISLINSTGGHTQHVGEYTIPLNGTSVDVDLVNVGDTSMIINILGFKHVSDTCGTGGSDSATPTKYLLSTPIDAFTSQATGGTEAGTIDLNTISGLVIPTNANAIILRTQLTTTVGNESNLTINGREISHTFGGGSGNDSDVVVSTYLIGSGNTITYTMFNASNLTNSPSKIEILGFEEVNVI